MQESLLDHHRSFGPFTHPGLYRERLQQDLPTDIRQIGLLVRGQLIHKVTLASWREGAHVNPAYGDLSKVPWYRQSEDDYFPTAAAMLAELYRRDPRGLVADRAEEHKLILSCRFVAILMASILKSRGMAARVRAGHNAYIRPGQVGDHWITQYWHVPEARWITLDADIAFETRAFDPFDLPPDTFDFAANAWLAVRSGKIALSHYNCYGSGALFFLAQQVICDWHCLMHNEVPYTYHPIYITSGGFEGDGDEQKLEEIDTFARLMQHPDENFAQLQTIWETNHAFRLLHGPLT